MEQHAGEQSAPVMACAECGQLASSRGEFHPPALSEPCLIVSDHTAPIVQSFAVRA